MRKYIRHPSDIPIDISISENNVPEGNGNGHHIEPLNNISEGGLSFHSDIQLDVGTVINIRIPVVEPTFEIAGRVAWCKRDDEVFDIGVEILDAEKVFQTRMVEQICHIEHYKKQVLASEGRKLSGKDAAMEWIEKYAHVFPDMESITGSKS